MVPGRARGDVDQGGEDLGSLERGDKEMCRVVTLLFKPCGLASVAPVGDHRADGSQWSIRAEAPQALEVILARSDAVGDLDPLKIAPEQVM